MDKSPTDGPIDQVTQITTRHSLLNQPTHFVIIFFFFRTEVTNSGPAELAVPHATECEDAAGAAVALADITDAVVAVAHDPTVTARTPAKAA